MHKSLHFLILFFVIFAFPNSLFARKKYKFKEVSKIQQNIYALQVSRKSPIAYSKIVSSGYNAVKERSAEMVTVKDVIVKKPSDEEAATCKAWPIWKCEPSTFDWVYTEKETCLVLEGKVMVSDGKESVSFGPGDFVVFPKDLECAWNITEAVTKHYNFG